jgi:acetyl esterase/lipase
MKLTPCCPAPTVTALMFSLLRDLPTAHLAAAAALCALLLLVIMRTALPHIVAAGMAATLKRHQRDPSVKLGPHLLDLMSGTGKSGRWSWTERARVWLLRALFDLGGSPQTLSNGTDHSLACDVILPPQAHGNRFLARCFESGDSGCPQCATADEISQQPHTSHIHHAAVAASTSASPVKIPVRVYLPKHQSSAAPAGSGLPIIIYFHGGGFVLGSPRSHDVLCHALCARTGACVVSVHYRLAPEHVFPAALDDCIAALECCHLNAPALLEAACARVPYKGPPLNPNCIFLSGDSAGGQLTLATALYARDHEFASYGAIRGLAPLYPTTDTLTEFPSMRSYCDSGLLLRRDDMTFFRQTYFGIVAAEAERSFLSAKESSSFSDASLTSLCTSLGVEGVGCSGASASSSAFAASAATVRTPRTGTPTRSASKAGRSVEMRARSTLSEWRDARRRTAAALWAGGVVSERACVQLSSVYFSIATHPMLDEDAEVSTADAESPLPPTLFVPCELDVLRDESLLMAARMRDWHSRAQRVLAEKRGRGGSVHHAGSRSPEQLVQIALVARAPHAIFSFPTAPEWSPALDSVVRFVRAHAVE